MHAEVPQTLKPNLFSESVLHADAKCRNMHDVIVPLNPVNSIHAMMLPRVAYDSFCMFGDAVDGKAEEGEQKAVSQPRAEEADGCFPIYTLQYLSSGATFATEMQAFFEH